MGCVQQVLEGLPKDEIVDEHVGFPTVGEWFASVCIISGWFFLVFVLSV